MENYLSKEKIKHLAKLSQKKYRQEFKEVVVDGLNVIKQLDSNGIRPKELYVRHDTQVQYDPSGISVYWVSEQDMKRICDTVSPQAIAGLYEIPASTEVGFKVALYLDGIHDPGNLGTIFRSAAAFGVEQIFLSEDSCEVFSPKVIRASLGSVFSLASASRDSVWLKNQDAVLISTSVTGGLPLHQFCHEGWNKIILVIGSEAHGVSEEIQQLCKHKIKIEMTDNMESINASVATSIILWWFFVQHKG